MPLKSNFPTLANCVPINVRATTGMTDGGWATQQEAKLYASPIKLHEAINEIANSIQDHDEVRIDLSIDKLIETYIESKKFEMERFRGIIIELTRHLISLSASNITHVKLHKVVKQIIEDLEICGDKSICNNICKLKKLKL